MIIRPLTFEEIDLLWSIDRQEIVEHIYQVKDNMLQRQSQFFNTQGWPEGEAELYTPILKHCFLRQGIFLGTFLNEQLIADCVVDSHPIKDYPTLHQLMFLHVSHAWRGQQLATRLYQQAQQDAITIGAQGFYISSTSTQRTVEFYLQQGAQLLAVPDHTLFNLEPEDIHLAHWF